MPGRKNADQHPNRDRARETGNREEKGSGKGLQHFAQDRYTGFQIVAKVPLDQPVQEVEVLNVKRLVQSVLLDEMLRQCWRGVGRRAELRGNRISGSERGNKKGN